MYPMQTLKPLTARQKQVLDLFVGGTPYRELAEELGIAPGTVYPHLKAIAKKIGSKGTSREALRVAYASMELAA